MVSGAFFSWIVSAISVSGYAGVIGLMALESACIPLPSEVIMPFSGYLVSTGRFDLWLVATAGAIGCNVGSTIAYLVGAYGGRKAVLRWGHYVLFSAEELDRLDRFFRRYGSAAVLIGRLLPVVRTFISLPTGISQMPFLRFQIYTFIGSWPWCLALAYIGVVLGKEWDSNPAVKAWFHRFDWAVVALIVLGFGFYIWHRWRASRQRA
jgi:membrane protein DedA with SNARE-associated domain